MLALPLLLCACGAGLAAALGLPWVNRRVSPEWMGLLLALAPAAAFGVLAALAASALDAPRVLSIPWIPSLGVTFTLYLDGLSLLMAMLVTGIGALVTLYGGHYFHGDRGAWRFLLYLGLFQAAMLGLVLAGDLILLFVFWELTSITSFLLIGYKRYDPAAQRGAFKSLLITGGGGIALLVGLLLLAGATGTTRLDTVLQSAEAIHASGLYMPILLLVALGAFTKSAQFPFHTWLPDGMTAPTPASAFLHSATMVKAGIYLLARLNPALGFTEPWFWLITSVGLVTMLAGAWLAFRATDLKALLAYTTIAQLGALTMLIGQDTAVAYQGLAVGILAHGLYKSALFMVAGSVDHAAGTRDLRRLGGLARAMPATMTVAVLAGLSMAGLPPMFGYLAKEALVASAAHPTLPAGGQWVLTAAALATGAMMTALAAVFVWETFGGRSRDAEVAEHAHEVSWGMWLCAGVPAAMSLLIVMAPLPLVKEVVQAAAGAAHGREVTVSFQLWKGFDLLKALGLLGMALGAAAFFARRWVRAAAERSVVVTPGQTLYAGAVRALDAGAWLATRPQNGQLRRYLLVMLAAVAALVLWADAWPAPSLAGLRWDEPWMLLRIVSLSLAASAALASVFLRHDLYAILSIGASGFGVALAFLLAPAPDVALVMLVVDLLTMVVLVMALTKLPLAQRREADSVDFQDTRREDLLEGAVAVVAGILFGGVTLLVLLSRPGESDVSPFYLANAKTLVGASDVVGSIVIDFRGFDTFIEIVVFGLAGVGIYTLVHDASPAAGDQPGPTHLPSGVLGTPFVHLLANLILPLSLVVAATHIMYGHAQPGDGFTAGVIVSLAVAFRYAVFGREHTLSTKRWLRPVVLTGLGLTLTFIMGLIGYAGSGSFLGHFDLTKRLSLPTPQDFALSTSTLFELCIAMTVLGGASLLIDTLSTDRAPEPSQETR